MLKRLLPAALLGIVLFASPEAVCLASPAPATQTQAATRPATTKPATTTRPKRISRRQLAVMQRRAMAALQRKQYARAVQLFEQVLKYAPKNPGSLYNTACAYSLKGDKAEAIDFLRRSLEAGWADFGHIGRDSDLDNIREEAAFKALLADRAKFIQKAVGKTITRLHAHLKKKGVDPKTYKTFIDSARNFIYLHGKTEEQLATFCDELAGYAEYQWEHLFTHRSDKPLYIVVLTEKDTPKVMRGGIGGFFSPNLNTLFCGDLAGYKLSRTSVVIHEFTHALHFADFRARGQMQPIWSLEGLATLFETSDRGETVTPQPNMRLIPVQAAVRDGKAFGWKKLFSLNQRDFMKKAGLAYAQSRYVFYYLYEQGLLKEFYDAFSQGKGKRTASHALRAITKVCGKPAAEVEKEWQAWVLDQPMPPFAFAGFQTVDVADYVEVQIIIPDGPADKHGIKEGDRITMIDGKPVAKKNDVASTVADHMAGDVVEVEVLRGDEKKLLRLTFGNRGEQIARMRDKPGAYLGLVAMWKKGKVTVTQVARKSPAAKAGLKVGEVIQEVDGEPLTSARDLAATVRKYRPGHKLKLKVQASDGKVRTVTVMLGLPPRRRR